MTKKVLIEAAWTIFRAVIFASIFVLIERLTGGH